MLYSVLLPAHRADQLLVTAVESVQRAIGEDNGELIVIVNGAARDAIRALLGRSSISTKTRIVESEIPSLIYCLNKGAECASGRYLARFDSDDVCMPDRFKRQLEYAEREQLDFVFCDAEVIDGNGVRTGVSLYSSTDLWRSCGPIHPTAVFRRDVLLSLGGYGNLEFSEDYHLWLRASLEGYKLGVIAFSGIKYRVHRGQVTDARRLSDTYATNFGLKMILGLRKSSSRLILGAMWDLAAFFYRKCRSAFF